MTALIKIRIFALWSNIDKIFIKQMEAIRAGSISISYIYHMLSQQLRYFCFKLFNNDLPPHFQNYLDILKNTGLIFDFEKIEV